MPALVPPDVRFEASYRDAIAEFLAGGERDDVRPLRDHESFAAFVGELASQSRGEGLPAGWVAGTTYWLVEGEHFLGYVEVRHRLTPALRLRGGHVGYAIRPSMRRRGYGTCVLTLVLPRCVELGIDRILVTCDATNQASRRIWIDIPAQLARRD